MKEVLSTDFTVHSQADIGPLIEPYRRELLLHSYRLLGSLHDAEDVVQETMLRAWRHFDTFTLRGPGSLRTWLYTIATNTSLDALKKRLPRTLPGSASPMSDPTRPIAPKSSDALWLEPFPDSWLTEATENPEALYTRHESISLAFLTALQILPPRQRAILLLSDVLDWRAVEIAQLLELSVGAVNSALHRARVTLAKNYHSQRQDVVQVDRADTTINTLLTRYLQAWETDDVDGLVALLKEDATISMPPIPSWYRGREAIRIFLRASLFSSGVQRQWRLFPTYANGQHALVVYRMNEATKSYRASTLQMVTLDGSQDGLWQIAEVIAFINPKLISSFGFPLQLSE